VRGEELLGDIAGGAKRGIEGFAVVLGETLTLGQALGIEDLYSSKARLRELSNVSDMATYLCGMGRV
jgi:hypothetical protein